MLEENAILTNFHISYDSYSYDIASYVQIVSNDTISYHMKQYCNIYDASYGTILYINCMVVRKI